MAGKRSNGEGSIIYDKRRKTYRARVTTGWETDWENGKTKQIIKNLGTFKTKGEAASALADFLKNPYNIENKDITFSQLYKNWFENYLTPETKSHEYRIKAAYRYCSQIYDKRIREITILDMKNCIYKGTALSTRGSNKGQLQLASPTTQESIKFLFNHIFGYAAEARLIERNYAKDFSLDKKVLKEKIKNHKHKTPFTEEELEKLWKSIDFVPFADMVVYACYSGWRPTELIKLKVKDVDWDNEIIKGGIKSEAGKNRIVPIHPLVKNIVKKYYDEAVEHNSDFLFNDPEKKKGIGLSYDQYLTRFNKVLALLKFRDEITPHYTRHTFITKAKSREVNMNEYILKTIVGHEIKDLTENTYTHREIEDLKEEMLKIKK